MRVPGLGGDALGSFLLSSGGRPSLHQPHVAAGREPCLVLWLTMQREWTAQPWLIQAVSAMATGAFSRPIAVGMGDPAPARHRAQI